MINIKNGSSREFMETTKKFVNGWLKEEKFMTTILITNKLIKSMAKLYK